MLMFIFWWASIIAAFIAGMMFKDAVTNYRSETEHEPYR